MKVDNAIIMAAGTSSRFAPLSNEIHKAMIEVNGEVLIERQIKQIKEAGIEEIIVVTGYRAEQFKYLVDKFGVKLIHNPNYLTRNNTASIYVVKDYLKNSYICSSDNYFIENPFEAEVDECYYSAVYVDGNTNEWCIDADKNGRITNVIVGGKDSWVMLGHAFWSEQFSKHFIKILEDEYDKPETANKLWESIYIDHIDELDMKIRKYPDDYIFEFDTLDELREFDKSYVEDTRSVILKCIAKQFGVTESKIVNVSAYKDNDNAAAGFTFCVDDNHFRYSYTNERVEKI
jgi:CTP:phosphocholine cytidylyltransferase-like protein